MTSNYWQKLLANRLSRRRAITGAAGVGIGATALSLIGCGGGGGGTQDTFGLAPGDIPAAWQLQDETRGAVPGGIYKNFRTADVTGGFDPFTTTSRSTTLTLADEVYENLLRIQSGPGVNPLAPRPYEGELAENFEVSDDGLTYTFKLRQNVHFHDTAPVNGRVMDTDDWKVSLERSIKSPYRPTVLDVFEAETPRFPDSRTMVLRAKYPYAPGPGLFASGTQSFYVMPKEAGDGRMDATTSVIGTSHKRMASYQPSIGFDFRKHEKYWRQGRPLIDRWHTPVLTEYANRLAQFITQNLSVFTPNQADVFQTRRDTPDAILMRADLSGGLTVNYFGYRELETAPYRDERVRQALSMTIDRKQRYEYFQNTAEFEAQGLPKRLRYNSHFSAGSYFWLNPFEDELGENSRYFKYDLAEARRLMQAAGHTQPLEIETHAHTGPNYGAAYQESAQIMVDMWNRSGLFRIRDNHPTYADWLPRIYQNRDYRGIALAHLGFGGNGDNDISLYNMYHMASGGTYRGLGDGTRNDPTVEAMIERQRREMDPERREAQMHDIQKYLAKKMYIITTEGLADSFYFRWPWIRNFGWPSWNHWIAQDAPRRDVA